MARLSPQMTQRAHDLIALYPQPRSALLPLLHLAQEENGYLPTDAMEHAAELVGITPAEVQGVATFYDMFHLEPVGRHVVSVCTNIACMLDGASELLEHAQETLDIRAGQTTSDGEFTLEEVECIALCGNAPCLAVNWRFFGDVDNASFDTLVDDLRSGALADTVPPHGTLNRVQRTVGLVAGGIGTAVAPPRSAGAKPGKTPTPSVNNGRETQPRRAGDVERAAAEVKAVEDAPKPGPRRGSGSDQDPA